MSSGAMNKAGISGDLSSIPKFPQIEVSSYDQPSSSRSIRRFEPTSQLEDKLECVHRKVFGRFTAREALLDEEFWILHQIEIDDEDEESESSDSESNDDLELSKVTEMRLLPSDAGKCSFLFLQMTTPISIEDVRREVKILKALSNHNNLVKFYDACEDALNVYVVMEYVLINSSGRYLEEDAKAIVIQILSVIAFCHLQGVVHRDLKPEALSKALTEDQLFYLRSQFKLLAPNGEGHISFDNFRMTLLQNVTESMKESKVIDILNVARHPFLLPFFLQLLSFFCMPPPLPLL
ncbi:hypothetical protein ZIOFF_011067 [Zingiber officinale]|uniref:Protein kinase domain-containing protein n=1 Tax=Zingiber officinale TaxID=94328 RepID=A0A8J5LPS7_ZINOF|nr:hypothetical protein ZIOFF_011067 [Zingiber officinale]